MLLGRSLRFDNFFDDFFDKLFLQIFLTNVLTNNLTIFFGKSEDTKRHFKINRPLGN